MDNIELVKEISRQSASKIVLIVMDGLGGLPDPATGKTELETARHPNLDKLAVGGICGLTEPVALGITPGSAPGHLALFGYDPVRYNIGRGALEAVGVDFDLKPGDVAARGNFCSVDAAGLITDRRAGRITTEQSAALTRLLDGMEIEGIKVFVQPVRDYRFIVVFRGDGLGAELEDSDPQLTGIPPRPVVALDAPSEHAAHIANEFIARAKKVLSGHHPANMLLLRGFATRPHLPSMQQIYKLKPAAVASYPMYRGLARLAGMDVLKTGVTVADEFTTLLESYDDFDFFFLHVKGADSAGEDGDFMRKASVIEEFDKELPRLMVKQPDVIMVGGDHSTPARLKAHSWHPVPFLLHSRYCRADNARGFGESECLKGCLGVFPATNAMPLAMANAFKLEKFGA